MFIFYNGALMLVGNDPGPQSSSLFATAILLITSGAIMIANLTGSIANVF